ncbi:MAG: xanthine dehydrogenase accessory protein XdhC [Pseudomonadota bacterium]
MNEWLDELARITLAGDSAVIVTVAGIRGSAPRECGAKMLVTKSETFGTIGGGQLEHECTRLAVGMLGAGQSLSVRKFSLGSSMGQCCGGVVDILFEPVDASARIWISQLQSLQDKQEPAIVATRTGERWAKFILAASTTRTPAGLPVKVFERARLLVDAQLGAEQFDEYFLEPVVPTDFNLLVFGAGHVGAAVVRALSAIDCNIRWVDSRAQMFRKVPAGVQNVVTSEFASEVKGAPSGSFYLIMTHSHALDFEICDQVLRRGDAEYCGLIGSVSKRRRFEKSYKQQGMTDAQLKSLTCPIGVHGISSKKPAELAAAVTAELLQVRERLSSMSLSDTTGSARPARR